MKCFRKGPSNDDEGFSVSADLKCVRKGPSNADEGFFVSADLKCFRKGMWGWGGGPLLMMKDSLFLPGGPTDYFITMFLLSSNEG